MNITLDEIRSKAPDGATHTNGNTYYMYEGFYEDEKGEWYRWLKAEKVWTEILNKPRNIKPL